MADVKPVDLLQPSIPDGFSQRRAYAQKPWRLDSLIWIGLLGGMLPMTAIAFLEARYLAQERLSWKILLWGGLLTVLLILGLGYASANWELTSRGGRLGVRAGGLLLYIVCRKLLVAADRVYQHVASEDAYDSLWKAGLLAVILGGLLQGAAIVACRELFVH